MVAKFIAIGTIFGKLTVTGIGIPRTQRSEKKLSTSLCTCACGGKVEVVNTKLNNGHTTSCGCKAGGKIDLTGKRFGRLQVIQSNGIQNNQQSWECLCDCGNKKTALGQRLRQGTITSCGCFQQKNRKTKGRWKTRITLCEVCSKEIKYSSSITPKTCSIKCHKQFTTDSARNRKTKFTLKDWIHENTLHAIRKHNKTHNTTTDLTSEYVQNLFDEQKGCCAITGISFARGTHSQRSPWTPSIDQIIPGEGYTQNNIQLVCLMYNLCKGQWRHIDVIKFTQHLLK